MFYRLTPGHILRGWEQMAHVLIRRPQNLTRPLPAEVFQLLLLCDGETDLSRIPLTPGMEAARLQYEQEGVIAPLSAPQPLEPDQYYKYYKNRYVQSIFWSITGRCNFRCRHCFMDAPDALLGELSTAEALDLIDQMADCGVLRVDLTGGEPLVRRDFWQLVDRILAHHMTIGKLYTNGWLLTSAVLDEFERRGLRPDISISFDGVGWHDWMRGIPGAEAAALRALKLCHERGLQTDVEMCIHRGNQNTLPQTIEALRAVGVQDLKVSNVSETPLWCSHCEGNSLTQQEYTEAMLPYIHWYYKTGRPIRQLILAGVIVLRQDRPYKIIAKPYDGSEKCLNCHLCSAARFACYIAPDGRLLPCMPMTASPEQDRFPKVQEIGLRQGLQDSFYLEFVDRRIKDLFAMNAECAACQYRYQCGGGCRATAVLHGDQNLMGCDRIMCTLWKEGYVQRITEAAQKAEAEYNAKVPQNTASD